MPVQDQEIDRPFRFFEHCRDLSRLPENPDYPNDVQKFRKYVYDLVGFPDMRELNHRLSEDAYDLAEALVLALDNMWEHSQWCRYRSLDTETTRKSCNCGLHPAIEFGYQVLDRIASDGQKQSSPILL